MDFNDGMFGEMMETAQNAAQSAQKGIQKNIAQMGKAAASQVTGTVSDQNQQGSGESAQQKKMSDDQAKQFLKDLYGPSKPQGDLQKNGQKPSSQPSAQNPLASAIGAKQVNPYEGKSPEEIAVMQKLRGQLHGEYYQSIVNPPKPQEEHVADKLEREEQEEEMKKIDEEKKKPDPLAIVKRGTGEKMVGASG